MLTERSQGGASINDGQLELMVNYSTSHYHPSKQKNICITLVQCLNKADVVQMMYKCSVFAGIITALK